MKTKLYGPLSYKKDQLCFDGKLISKIAQKKPTPFYLYSKKTIQYYYKEFLKEAQKNNIPSPLICYALKANANADVLKVLKSMGCGADVVSGGELKLAIKAGIPAEKIVFSGVAKTAEEIEYALKVGTKGIYSFNVESIEELELINNLAKKHKKIARVAFRLNPQVNAKTHKNISTGNKTHKFGILKEDILEAMEYAPLWTHTNLVGISIHIGSQLTDMKATEKAIEEVAKLALKLPRPLEFFDLGGGLGIDYTDDDRKKLTLISEYMKKVSTALEKHYFSKVDHCPRIVFEPGRILVGKMGIIVSKVVRNKVSDGHRFTILDAGMNDLMRPALYEAYHEITAIKKTKKKIKADIVGPICESSDCFGENRIIDEVEAGDLMIIENAGAYGQTMANTYNQRQIAKEYLI